MPNRGGVKADLAAVSAFFYTHMPPSFAALGGVLRVSLNRKVA